MKRKCNKQNKVTKWHFPDLSEAAKLGAGAVGVAAGGTVNGEPSIEEGVGAMNVLRGTH